MGNIRVIMHLYTAAHLTITVEHVVDEDDYGMSLPCGVLEDVLS
jgi:hypothetical protein